MSIPYFHRRAVIIGAAAAAGLLALALPAVAQDAASADGTIKVTQSWTRATPAGAKVAGGFLKITNRGTKPDKLLGGSLDRAPTVEVHEMSMSNGVMKMQKLAQGLEIKPGETVELKPGGYHMMFIGLTAPVKEGDNLKGTLIFERAGTISLDYHTAPMGAAGHGH